MKTITDNQLHGELGETLVKAKVLKMGHPFQGLSRLETGIDGIIELRDQKTGQQLGKMIAVQVKLTAGGRYTAETDAGFEYLLRMSDLEYWRSNNLPVIIVLYRHSDDSFYWKSVTEGAPTEERRLIFSKVDDVFDGTAMDRIANLAVERGRHGSYVPPMLSGEPAHLNLVRLVLPDEIFVAESPFKRGQDAVPELIRAEGRDFDWVIRDRRFVSFRNPIGTPLEAIVIPDTVEAVDTELVAASDDREDEVVMIELLRRTLDRQLSADLAWDKESRAFFFKAEEQYAERVYAYRSLKSETSATVVGVYMDKKRKDRVNNLRHHAFIPRFERLGDDWFLSISPTFVFTEDGFRPHRFAHVLLAGKKRFERNAAIRGQFLMWRSLLHESATAPAPDLLSSFSDLDRRDSFIGFENVEPIAMPQSVPEEAWVRSDPNAKKMKAEVDWLL